MTDKPPYSVPMMSEIRDIPWNGFNAVSTFSGGGGSSTGYRMAGFRMLWANEVVTAAQDTYRANQAPHTVLDTRDIREVTGADLLSAAGLGVGDLDLFDGSPPCGSFSTVGNREKDWWKIKQYTGITQRADDLFFEYTRLIRETQPRTFVAENVYGLVKGSAKGYFKIILADLKSCGYRVEARLLNAAWLGVPQARRRIIFIGVREDLNMSPVFPKPLPYQYSVRDALPWIAQQGNNGWNGRGAMRDATAPSPTLLSGPMWGGRDYYPGKVSQVPEAAPAEVDPETGYPLKAKRIHDTDGKGTFRGLSKGNVTETVSPPLTTQINQHMVSGDDVELDPETGYPLSMVGYAVHGEWRHLKPGEKSKKYFQVMKQDPNKPYETIMAGQGNRAQTGPSHWTQPRKLTLGELRALSGFPADFVLTGSYSERWARIGMAVPPVMMSHIATAVRDGILIPLREAGTI